MNYPSYFEDQLPHYKIIILGRTNSGKTKLLTRYKCGTYTDEGHITIGVDSLDIKTTKAKFTYFDTVGQQKFKSIVSSYVTNKDACLLVYDVSSNKSFEEMFYYYNLVKQKIPDALLYIVGCKSDLGSQVSEQTVYKYYKGYRHQVTSSKNNQNIIQTFKALEQQLLTTNPKTVKDPTRKTIVKPTKIPGQKCCN